MGEAAAPTLIMQGIAKSFLGVVALDEAALTVMPGEVHAVIGQNGAGKSTLMKILNGVYRRDAGSVLLQGKPVDFHSPQDAQSAGVSTIYQEINLVPYRSVAENIFMGREPTRWGLLDTARMNREAGEIPRLDLHIGGRSGRIGRGARRFLGGRRHGAIGEDKGARETGKGSGKAFQGSDSLLITGDNLPVCSAACP